MLSLLIMDARSIHQIAHNYVIYNTCVDSKIRMGCMHNGWRISGPMYDHIRREIGVIFVVCEMIPRVEDTYVVSCTISTS